MAITSWRKPGISKRVVQHQSVDPELNAKIESEVGVEDLSYDHDLVRRQVNVSESQRSFDGEMFDDYERQALNRRDMFL